MEKFIILNASGPKVDKQITLTLTNATGGDIDKINDAVAELWSKGYTESTIPVTLSSAVTAVS